MQNIVDSPCEEGQTPHGIALEKGNKNGTEKVELFTIEKKEHDKLPKVVHGTKEADKKLLFSISHRKKM